jgi:effector-binding domain-containing protein
MKKEISEKWVLFTKHILNSPIDIGEHASQDEPHLRNLAERNGLLVTAPLEHAYWNMAVEGVPHILEIWLPVQANPNGNPMQGIKRVEEYRCFAAEFKKPIEEIGNAWMELGELAKKFGLQLTNHDREIYKTMDCDAPERNDIELQMGIK